MSSVPPDEHLRAALRHAPDATLAAPPDLSAHILAAAHRAAAQRPAPAPVRRRGWLAGWGGWQLGASGALASVLMAGFITLLWRGEPPPVVAETSAPVSVAAPLEQAPAAAPSTSAPAVMATTAKAAAAATAAERTPVADAIPERMAADLPRDRTANTALQQRPALPAPPPAAPGLPLPALQAAAPEAAADPPPVPLGRARAAPAPPAAAPAPARAEALAQKAAPPAVASMLAARPMLRDEDSTMAVAMPADLQWRLDGRLHSAPVGWLMQLQQSTRAQGSWQAAPGATPQPGEQEVAWSSGNVVLGRLWLGRGRVLWCTPENHCEVAALSPQAARDLLARLVPQ